MRTEPGIRPSDALRQVRYKIRGRLARRALELERACVSQRCPRTW